MHFQNAVAAYMNRLRELRYGNQYTSERFLDVVRYCCRKHVEEVGGSYLSVFNDAIKQASENHKVRFQ